MIKRSWFMVAGALSAALISLAPGCGSSGGGTGGGGSAPACTPDLASIQQTIFTPQCATSGCHAGDNPAAALSLAAGTGVEARLVGVEAGTCDGPLVTPGSLDHSFLYDKITSAAPRCGAHMPSGGDLTAEQKECIRAWIAGLPAPDGGSGGGGGCETCGGSACVDLQTDAANCGACGKTCPTSASCANGACACPGGLMDCGGACVDTMTSAANCGSCGKSCPTGAACAAGACACPAGTMECNGACVQTASDPANCGSCGKACAGGEVCNMGQCASGCGALTQCGGACVDTMTNASNCGSCGKACALGASCAAGQCQCPAGKADCNGTCIDVNADPTNCGTCGKVCGAGTSCVNGQCQCPGGGTPCNGVCVDTQTDANNCGTCGNVCAIGQTCSAGTCACGTSSVSFAQAVQPIFTAACASAGCHTGVMPQQGLNLSTGKAYNEIVNVAASECNDQRKLVLPGQPSQSYLIQKMMNVNLCFGTKMPKLGSLQNAQIQTVADWICAGAPNN